jgi:hypothetical protein
MSFKVRIVFTGLCSFILNKDPTQQVRACVVLPDGEGGGIRETLIKKAPDGTPLLRHRAFVRFKLPQLDRITDKTSLPVDAEGLWYIEGKRVAFRFQEGAADNSFKVDTSLPNYLLGMDELAGTYADDYLDIVQATPAAGVVTSQILLHRGLLKNEYPISKLSTWVIPGTLNGKTPPLRKILTHEVTLELLDISAVEMVATPLAGGAPEIVKLVSAAGEDVNITISHLCSDNPLRWTSLDKPLKDDEDYKWHYMLLSPAVQTNLEMNVLGGMVLPVPLRPLGAGTGGQGVNCPPTVGLPRNINLDNYL